MRRFVAVAALIVSFAGPAHTQAKPIPPPYAALRQMLLPNSAVPSYFLRSGVKLTGSNKWGKGTNTATEKFDLPVGRSEGDYGLRIAETIFIYPNVQAAADNIQSSKKLLAAQGLTITSFYLNKPGDVGKDSFTVTKFDSPNGHRSVGEYLRHGFIEALWVGIIKEGAKKPYYTAFDELQALDQHVRAVAAWKVPVAQF